MKKFILVFALLLSSGCGINKPSGNLTAIFFDVGQGDSALIITPDSRKILVDCGEYDDAARYLGIMNITKLDVLIITHPDSDHAGGCDEVRKTANVSRIITNENTKKDFKLGITKTARLDVIVAYDSHGRYKDDNDNSILLKIKYGKSSFLFTGDCGEQCENELIKTENIDVDVLKVGHHGSKYSSSEKFLAKTTPSIAVISVGKNSYSHPANDTLERLGKV
ncbi:MBL fold metallo-hydrolase, partial [Candidatus Woesearchaeota archaeon]|nr:MBL fold metallo-hydrolase [Candidatus Woesearchaeota archaeon]